MRIMLAPDSFKGSLSAVEVTEIMEEAVVNVFPEATFVKIPLADGGEGTVDSFITATNGKKVYTKVKDPLGREIESFFGVSGDGTTAVVEMAAASGITLLKEDEKNPLITTTYGTGQLIQAALDHGCSKIIVGIGGSATNDGGAGMAQALGARFLDADGKELEPGGAALLKLKDIDISGIDLRIKRVEIEVACDVNNPLCGPQGASAIYGPQKGATGSDIKLLDEALKNYAAVIKKKTGKEIENLPGAGAAGGLGAGIVAFLNGKLKPGIDILLKATSFSEKVKNCDLVFTGEGKIDGQTIYGKVPVGVAREAKRFDLPVLAFAGIVGPGYEKVYEKGIDVVIANVKDITDIETAIKNAKSWLSDSVQRAMRLVRIGNFLKGV